MSPVSTHQAALTAIDGADIGSASLEECVELQGHFRCVRQWLDDVVACATGHLVEHDFVDRTAFAGLQTPVQNIKSTVLHPPRKVCP